MRKTLLIAAFIFGWIGSNAQKIELGLNGGLAPYIWADDTFKGYTGTTKYKPGYYGSFKVGLILGGWQIGAAADMFQTQVEAVNSTISANDFKNITKYQNITPYLFANKLFRLPKSFLYAGLNGGINIGTSKTQVTGVFNYNANATHSGFNGGVQAGYTIKLVKGFAANAEAGARYIHMENKAPSGKGVTADHIIFPVSLGLRYIL